MSKTPTQKYSFDDSEFDTEEDELSTSEYEEGVADTVVNALSGSSTKDIDDQLEDVEERLELAAHYRVLLNNNPFNDESVAAVTVGNELKEFVKGRLRVLLGLRPDKVPEPVAIDLPFDEDEVRALKMLAAKVCGKPQLLEQKKDKPKEPSIRKVEAPTSRPAVKAQQPKQQPVLRKPTQEPVVRTPKTPPANGDIIKKNGKKYKAVVAEGVWEDGTPETKTVLVDVTGQVRHPHAAPMPTGVALEMVTMQKAAENIQSSTEGNSALVNSAILHLKE